MTVNKELFYDSKGRYLTQGLFLEIGYKTQFAVYTLDGKDKDYKGKIYPSLKRLYLEMEDPTEYSFAIEHLADWDHWLRLKENKVLSPYFQKWKDELDVLLMCQAVKNIQDISSSDSGFQANKWLADRGWEKRRAGRPSKEEQQRRDALKQRVDREFSEDFDRMKGLSIIK